MSETMTSIAARTGTQYLEGLRARNRELWLDGQCIRNPLDHPLLAPAAHSLARVYDLQHEHPELFLAPSPDDGRLVNITHLIPRTREDLERRRKACQIVAASTAGMMGRTPIISTSHSPVSPVVPMSGLAVATSAEPRISYAIRSSFVTMIFV
jgi:aromatic ring hydroxylase